MFTCLPGAMLLLRHILECSKGSSCERALLNDTFATAESHSWFNQAPPEALLLSGSLEGFRWLSCHRAAQRTGSDGGAYQASIQRIRTEQRALASATGNFSSSPP